VPPRRIHVVGPLVVVLVTLLLFGVIVSAAASRNGNQGVARAVGPAEAQGVVIRVQPAVQTVDVGGVFTVAVDISGAADVGGFEFAVQYDRTVLTVTDGNLGPFLGSTGRQTISLGPLYSDTTSITSAVSVGGVSYSGGGVVGASGEGTLAVLTLLARAPGSTLLQLGNIKLTNVQATPQSATPQSGEVTVTGGAGGTTTPAPTVVGTVPVPTPTLAAMVYLPLVVK
jgi:hypothetical protein